MGCKPSRSQNYNLNGLSPGRNAVAPTRNNNGRSEKSPAFPGTQKFSPSPHNQAIPSPDQVVPMLRLSYSEIYDQKGDTCSINCRPKNIISGNSRKNASKNDVDNQVSELETGQLDKKDLLDESIYSVKSMKSLKSQLNQISEKEQNSSVPEDFKDESPVEKEKLTSPASENGLNDKINNVEELVERIDEPPLAYESNFPHITPKDEASLNDSLVNVSDKQATPRPTVRIDVPESQDSTDSKDAALKGRGIIVCETVEPNLGNTPEGRRRASEMESQVLSQFSSAYLRRKSGQNKAGDANIDASCRSQTISERNLDEKTEEKEFLNAMDEVSKDAVVKGNISDEDVKTINQELGLNPDDNIEAQNLIQEEPSNTYLSPNGNGTIKISQNKARNSIIIERDDGITHEIVEIAKEPIKEPLNKSETKLPLFSQISIPGKAKQTKPYLVCDSEMNSSLIDDFPLPEDASNVLSKFLTPNLYDKYKNTVTKSGYTIDQCLIPGVDHPYILENEAPCILAFESDCYYAYSDLFDEIIKYHQPNFQQNLDNRPNLNPTPLLAFNYLDERGEDNQVYGRDLRISVSRNITGFPFPPGFSREQRKFAESILCQALNSFPDDLRGVYYPLTDLDDYTRDMLVDLDIMVLKPSDAFDNTGITHEWPLSRGLWLSDDRHLVAVVNEIDHVKFIAINNSNIYDAFSNVCRTLEIFERNLLTLGHVYVWSFSRGYLVSNPAYVGTAMVCATLIAEGDTTGRDAKQSADLPSTPIEIEDVETIYISNKTQDKTRYTFDSYGDEIRIQSLPMYPVAELEQLYLFYDFVAQVNNRSLPVTTRNDSGAMYIRINGDKLNGDGNSPTDPANRESSNETSEIKFPLLIQQKNDLSRFLTPTLFVEMFKRSSNSSSNKKRDKMGNNDHQNLVQGNDGANKRFGINHDDNGEDNSELENMLKIGISDCNNTSNYLDGIVFPNTEAYQNFSGLVGVRSETENSLRQNFDYKTDFWRGLNDSQGEGDTSQIINGEEVSGWSSKFHFDEFISSCFIHSILNYREYAFTPFIENELTYGDVLSTCKDTIENAMVPRFAGTFYDFSRDRTMELHPSSKDETSKIKSIFPYPSWDASKTFFRCWPFGRAYWLSTEGTMLCWINETDHLKFFALAGNGAHEEGVYEIWDCYQAFVSAYKTASLDNDMHVTDFATTFPSLAYRTSPFYVGAIVNAKNRNLNYLRNLLILTDFQIVNNRAKNLDTIEVWVIQRRPNWSLLVEGESETGVLAGKDGTMYDSFSQQLDLLLYKLSYLRFLIKHSWEDDIVDEAFKELKICMSRSGGRDHNNNGDGKDINVSSSLLKQLVGRNFNSYPWPIDRDPQSCYGNQLTSLMRHLTPALYEGLKDYKTSHDFTLDDCIQYGVDRYYSSGKFGREDAVGFVALDEECYDLFGPEIVEPILGERSKDRILPSHKFIDLNYLPVVCESFDPNFVFFVEFTVIRNIDGYPLVPGFRYVSQLKQTHELLMQAINSCSSGQLSNSRLTELKVVEFTECSEEELANILSEHFDEEESLLALSPAFKRFWPRDRARITVQSSDQTGNYSQTDIPDEETDADHKNGNQNEKSKILAYINVVDHLQCVMNFTNHDVWAQFRQLYMFLYEIETQLAQGRIDNLGAHQFMRHDKYGYVTTDPIYLGAGLGIRIRLKLRNILGKANKMRGTLEVQEGDRSSSFGGNGPDGDRQDATSPIQSIIHPILNHYNLKINYYDDQTIELTNRTSYGYSEVELFQQIIDCTKDLIRKEMELSPESRRSLISLNTPPKNDAYAGEVEKVSQKQDYEPSLLTQDYQRLPSINVNAATNNGNHKEVSELEIPRNSIPTEKSYSDLREVQAHKFSGDMAPASSDLVSNKIKYRNNPGRSDMGKQTKSTDKEENSLDFSHHDCEE